MRDVAAMAAQSDPGRNGMFHRRWTGPPPPGQRKGQGRRNTLASFGKLNLISADTDSTATQAGERAVCKAERRAAELDRRARLYHDLSLVDAGLRAQAVAAEIREALA
jgi:hypothetical protein